MGWKGPLEIIESNPLLRRVPYDRLHRQASEWILNTSREGDSLPDGNTPLYPPVLCWGCIFFFLLLPSLYVLCSCISREEQRSPRSGLLCREARSSRSHFHLPAALGWMRCVRWDLRGPPGSAPSQKPPCKKNKKSPSRAKHASLGGLVLKQPLNPRRFFFHPSTDPTT